MTDREGLWSQEPKLKAPIELALGWLKRQGLLLICGPSGSGKSHLARWLHEQTRKNAPYIVQEAAGLADGLSESRLFGHKRGAFSGASNDQPGLASLAQQGSLCIENIEDLPHASQAKLLRFIQERSFRVIGATSESHFQGQLIFTSRHSFSQLKQYLRDDFLFRLGGHDIALPPQRPSDHDQLFHALLQEILRQIPQPIRIPDQADCDALRNQPLKGNLHGMRNLLLQATMRAVPVQTLLQTENLADREPCELGLPNSGSLKQDLLLLEQRLLQRALTGFQGTRQELADQLGISLRSLMYKLKELESAEQKQPTKRDSL